jgi:hypothetical protein
MKKFYSLLLFFISVLLNVDVYAQEGYKDDLEFRKWRITLIPPLSTNGVDAINYSSRRSINIIGGYHGGLDGWEIGLLFNATRKYARELQIAGGVNYSSGDIQGVQLAGVTNISLVDMGGLQVAGIANVTKRNLSGLSIAGITNASFADMDGLQVAGIANVAKKNLSGLTVASITNASFADMDGLQVAGIANVAKKNLSGLTVASITNASFADMDGWQVAGIANLAKQDLSGLTVAGITNASFADMDGWQVAGIANVSLQSMDGLIVSGVVNASKQMEGLTFAGIGNLSVESSGLQIASINASKTASGLQIGVLNIAKEFDGASIGVLSLYGNGRYNIDARYSDAGFVDYAFTTGTHRVYNMAILGYNKSLDRDVFRIGLGVGLEKNIQDSFENLRSNTIFVNQEFSVYHMFEDEWDRTLNYIFSYKYLIGNRFGNGISVYAGPSFNMQVTQVENAEDYSLYSLWSPSSKGRNYQFWVGFTAGLRIFKQKNLPLLEYSIKSTRNN